jgi:hypothetical protein
MFRSYDNLHEEIYTDVYIVCVYNVYRCIYFRLKMVVRPKHVADNLNRTVNN